MTKRRSVGLGLMSVFLLVQGCSSGEQAEGGDSSKDPADEGETEASTGAGGTSNSPAAGGGGGAEEPVPGTGGAVSVLPVDPTVNLAKGHACVSSANYTAGLPCELALDGVMSQESRWESQQGVDDGWMYVDLGAVYEVGSVDIYWEHSGALIHEVQVWTKYAEPPSDVDADWTVVAQEDNLANGEHHDLIESLYDITPVATQYVRVRCYKRMWTWGNSIFELEVYGAPG